MALVDLLAPAFKDDPRWQDALLLADDEVSPAHCFRDRVIVLLAAHMLEIADKGVSAGSGMGSGSSTQQVQSKREGDLATTFFEAKQQADVADSSGALGQTAYGAEVLRLNRLCFGMAARTAWP